MLSERTTRTYNIETGVTEVRLLRASKDTGPEVKAGEFICYGKVVKPPQQSIHPRVVNGRTVHKKVNTMKGKRQ